VIEAALDDTVHIISIDTSSGISRGEALGRFFGSIQHEIDAAAGKALRATQPQAFEPVEAETLNVAYESDEAPDLLEASSNLCFVSMPQAFNALLVYQEAILPAVGAVGLTAIRADDINMPGPLLEHIRAAIRESRILVADISEGNANVHYEVGLAHSMGKHILLIGDRNSAPPSDVAGHKVLLYDSNDLDGVRSVLTLALQRLLEHGRLDEARSLIARGLYRAAIAVLAVMVEHSLRRLLRGSSVSLQKTNRMSISSMARQLESAGVLSRDARQKLDALAGIRNKAVHDLAEPTREQAETALELVCDLTVNVIPRI
jgi:hypothetical protein